MANKPDALNTNTNGLLAVPTPSTRDLLGFSTALRLPNSAASVALTSMQPRLDLRFSFKRKTTLSWLQLLGCRQPQIFWLTGWTKRKDFGDNKKIKEQWNHIENHIFAPAAGEGANPATDSPGLRYQDKSISRGKPSTGTFHTLVPMMPLGKSIPTTHLAKQTLS